MSPLALIAIAYVVTRPPSAPPGPSPVELERIRDDQAQSGWRNFVADTGAGAAVGGTIGAAFGGVGAVPGTVIGAVVGGLGGQIARNWDDLEEWWSDDE